MVRRLRDEHPAADVRLFEEESAEPRIGELDLLFFDGRVGGEVEQTRILIDPYAVVARRGVFPPGPVPLAALDGVAMVAQPPICDQARVERVYAGAGVAPRIVFRTADNRGVLSMVRAGLGIAVLPRLALDIRPDDDVLTAHPLDPVLTPREIWLAWPANRTLSPLAERARELALGLAVDGEA
ncbi:LysR family transcriptional regulator substrate-binding protein [Amycolatopsis sp. NPDC051371]|uniref:LysR family transcriptional regulator substrate-binding protein n=1 Tax=Amycolatopsis sp. NPDC051371 TaxID=3155800 RepID=UPI00343B7666